MSLIYRTDGIHAETGTCFANETPTLSKIDM